MNRNNISAVILLVIAACLWGTMPIPIQLANYDPLWTAWIRATGNAIVLGCLFRAQLAALGRPRFVELVVGGLFFTSLLSATVGMKFTSATNSMVYSFIAPFAALLAEALGVAGHRYRTRARDLALMLVMLAGLVIMAGGLTLPGKGDLLAIGGGFFWGFAMPKGQSLGKRFVVAVVWQQLFGVILIPVICWLKLGSPLPPTVGATQAGLLALLVAVGSGAYVLFTRATSRDVVSPHLNQSLQVAQVLSATCLGYLVLGQSLSLRQALGALIIIGAAIQMVRVKTSSEND